jgi:hypothetical protein
MIPLGLKQNVPGVHSRNPQYPGYPHDTVPVILEFDQYCTGLLFCSNYPVFVVPFSYPVFIQLCVRSVACSILPFMQLFNLFYSCSICFVRLFSICLFAYSVFNYSTYSVLLFDLILELYSRYFHPVIHVLPSAWIAVWRYWFRLSRLSMMVIGSFASYTKTKSVESAV